MKLTDQQETIEEELLTEEDTPEAVAENEVLPETEPLTDPISEETVEALADGFLLLQQEVPELTGIADVPEAVLQEAVRENLPLLDAYLRYRWREERAVREEQERQRRTGEQAAGSLYTGSGQQHPEADAFARAFEQALR